MTFRFKNADVKMPAAEEDFELSGQQVPRRRAHHRRTPIAPKLEPMLKDLGLSAWAVAAAPSVKTHDLDVPRIGYVHSWTRTQDEGWVRAALDTYGVPYTYFADQKLSEGNLRAKYDVIIFPHVGGTAQSQVNGMAMTGNAPLPYKKTDKTPNLGFVDQTDDIRGGMGIEGLTNLAKFVQEGGTLITEGSTATIFPEYGDHERRHGGDAGAAVRARLDPARQVDRSRRARSPTATTGSDLPVYFNQAPVLNAGGGGIPPEFAAFVGGGAARTPGLGQNITPNAHAAAHLAARAERRGAAADAAAAGRCGGGVPAAWRAQFGVSLRRRASARRAVVPAEPERHAAVGHARRRPGPRRTAPRSSTRRSARATS